MGTVYTLPVVTADTLIANGMKIATRNETGNYYICGSNIADSKLAAFSDNSALREFYPNFPQGNGFMFVNDAVWDYIYYAGSSSISNIGIVTIMELEYLWPGYDSFVICTDSSASITLLPSIDVFPTDVEAAAALGLTIGSRQYPITYHYINSSVTGPLEAAVGDTVTVSAVPDVGYGITDASTQILVTNNDIAVPYAWDAANQRITFTMPDPS